MVKCFDTSLGTVRVYELSRLARHIAGTQLKISYRAKLDLMERYTMLKSLRLIASPSKAY